MNTSKHYTELDTYLLICGEDRYPILADDLEEAKTHLEIYPCANKIADKNGKLLWERE